MNRKAIPIALIVVIAGIAGAWFASRGHHHQLVRMTDEQGKVYWTCPMHPQVHQDHPGNCPICGMKLVQREEGVSPAQQPAQGDGKVLYWYDPMRPDQHFDKPGKSPFMDMELVPKYAAASSEQGGIVQIDPRMVQNLGIRTAKVERGSTGQRLDAVGSVDVDERRIVAIESRAAGWVEEFAVRSLGEPVKRGQRIAGVYSPDLFAAQQELVIAVRSKDEELISATRQRISLLGISPAQIDAVLRTGKPERQVAVIAPSDGVVTELNVRQGQQVMPGTPLMRVADLSQVWITIEVPELQGGSIAEGQKAEARLSAMPGKTFEGKVEYVYPRLETQTRTLRARIALPNPDGALRPGMFANVSITSASSGDALVVPSEAVIRTGERNVVILDEGEGKFRPAMVKVGNDRQGQTEILEGLNEGETIVVSGQFLIDSEASLSGALARMSGAPQ